MFLARQGYDVRDVCANRTPRSDRARQRGKSDTLDSERIAREVLAHPLLPRAFKRAGQDSGPDEQHQLLALWHNRRRSILTSRQHLVGEAEMMLSALALELREQLPRQQGGQAETRRAGPGCRCRHWCRRPNEGRLVRPSSTATRHSSSMERSRPPYSSGIDRP